MANRPGKGRRDPLLEIPGARVDPSHAGQFPFVYAAEGAALSLALDPRVITLEVAEQHRAVSELARELVRRTDLIKRATVIGRLAELIAPIALLNWLDEVGIEVDTVIRHAIERRQVPKPAANLVVPKGGALPAPLDDTSEGDSELPSLRQRTYDKIVLGIAIRQYGYRPSAMRSPAANQFAAALGDGPFRTHPQTIRDVMREAAERLGFDEAHLEEDESNRDDEDR